MSKLFTATKIIVDEARRRKYNIEVILDKKNFVKISKNNKFIYIKHTKMPINNSMAMFIAKDKQLTNIILQKNKLPSPKHYNFSQISELDNLYKKINKPFVLKAPDLSWGKDVYTNIFRKKDVYTIAKRLLKKYKEVILEEYVEGNDYRLLVIDGKFFSAVERIPARIIGDGAKNIKELIEIENKNPLRGEGGKKPLVTIKIDDSMVQFLKRKGLDLKYIPKKQEIVVLREVANQSQGGEVIWVTPKVNNEYKKLAEKAALAIGLKFAGIDIISQDISKNLKDTKGKIIEVNNSPDFDINQYPPKGKGDNVGKAVFDMIEKYCFK